MSLAKDVEARGFPNQEAQQLSLDLGDLLRENRASAHPRFIDLFAGIGGMRIGFEKAGAVCVYSCEWNRYSQKTYFANFKECPDGDIRSVPCERIPIHDILVGGFPCQPFSLAGVSKKNALGRPTGFADQAQGTLFFEICRILAAHRPKAFLLENVKNLTSHDGGRTFDLIRRSIDELGYTLSYQIIDGRLYVPQHRERIFMVGFNRQRYGDVDFDFDLHPPETRPVASDILEEHVDPKYTLTDSMWQYLQRYAEKHRRAGHGFGFGIVNPDGASRTISARYHKDGSEALVAQEGRNPRRLTPRECARLQGFDDSFQIPVSDTQAYRQFGNSVVVPLVADLAGLIVTTLAKLDDDLSEETSHGSNERIGGR